VAFVKRGDEYVVVMNEEDLPSLRLNQGYRRLLTQDGAEKDVKDLREGAVSIGVAVDAQYRAEKKHDSSHL